MKRRTVVRSVLLTGYAGLAALVFVLGRGHTILLDNKDAGGGAIRAIEEFMSEPNDFELDRRWEFLYGTNVSENLKGYLRRKSKG